MPRHHVYRILSEHRGTKRLWLQGKRLADVGAVPGTQFNLVGNPANRSVVIVLATDGDRLVSSKEDGRVPVIDINTVQLLETLGDITRILVSYEPGRITVTVHPDEVAAETRRDRLRQALENGESLRIGSVFHGAGILDHAVHQGLSSAGVASHLGFAVEIDERYLNTSLANNPLWRDDTLAICGSADEIDVRELGWAHGLIMGIPCTGASLSGRAKNRNEFAESHNKVGHLFINAFGIIKAVNPAFLVIENVTQYLTTPGYIALRAAVQVLGYDFFEITLAGPEYGSLEDRKRLCAVIVTHGMPIPFSFDGMAPVRLKEKNLGEIIDPSADNWKPMTHLIEKAKRDKQTYAEKGWGTGFQMQIVTVASETVGVIGQGYRRIRSTEPKFSDPDHPGVYRQFTPQEHAGIKTIPFFLVAGAAASVQHEMMGQSVCFCAFEALGRHLGQYLLATVTPVVVEEEMEVPEAYMVAGSQDPRQLYLF